MSISIAENKDCMLAMREFPDKYFELAIVDPEFGININHNIGRRKGDKPSNYKKVTWDSKIPNEEYFSELFRVSKNQIVWGGNYFPLPPCKCFVIWDKQFSEDVSFSTYEMAWTSFDSTAKGFVYAPAKNKNRIHPTQKPIALYKWLLKKYAKQGDKILDTHLGSGSSRIACYDTGFDFWGYELDKDYFEAQEKRFKDHISQERLFVPQKEIIQDTELFP